MVSKNHAGRFNGFPDTYTGSIPIIDMGQPSRVEIELIGKLNVFANITIMNNNVEDFKEFARDNDLQLLKASNNLGIFHAFIIKNAIEVKSDLPMTDIVGSDTIRQFFEDTEIINEIYNNAANMPAKLPLIYHKQEDRKMLFKELNRLSTIFDYCRGDVTNLIIGITMLSEMDVKIGG